jgi:tetratricopeptide (TPR) repeat protein
MTNSDSGYLLFPEIERTVWAAMRWPGGEPAVERVALSPPDRAALVGRYLRDDRVLIQVVERDGKLWISVPFFPVAEAIPVGSNELADRNDGKRLRRTAAGGYEIGVPARGGLQPVKRLDPSVQVPYELLAAGQHDAAIALWKRLVAAPSPPGFVEEAFANQLGYGLIQLGQTAAAVTLLGAVVEVFPTSANAVDSHGDALLASGKRAEALAAFERALTMLDADPAIGAGAKPAWRKQVEGKLAELRAAK